MSFASSISALRCLVGIVTNRCARKQMGGIATRRIVAMVAHSQALRDGSESRDVRSTVGRLRVIAEPEPTVPVPVTSAQERPASIGTTRPINFRPQTLSNWPWCWAKLFQNRRIAMRLPPLVMLAAIATSIDAYAAKAHGAFSVFGNVGHTLTLTGPTGMVK